MKPDLKLISMGEIRAEEVKWLWYPYLPRGKLTIVQGDPGEGKTTFVLAIIAALTRGEALPESEQALEPLNVIYQTAEDGLADTIKPRLDAAGADCSRVLVIDESQRELTLCDHRLEQAVQQTRAQLIVLDPIQAYLGDGVDMHRANEVRPVLKRVAAMAERTGCAVILIGHMNKAQGLRVLQSCILPSLQITVTEKRRFRRRRFLPFGRASIASGYTPATVPGHSPGPQPLKGRKERQCREKRKRRSSPSE